MPHYGPSSELHRKAEEAVRNLERLRRWREKAQALGLIWHHDCPLAGPTYVGRGERCPHCRVDEHGHGAQIVLFPRRAAS